jgi:DNA-directed RNA polymerase subunit RPC12/RpoP
MNDIDRDFVYKCSKCDASFSVTLKQNDPSYREPKPCTCGHVAEYEYFLPIKMTLRGKVAFDQNGRKGYAITDGKGGVRYVSATKMHYQETGDIKPIYTKAYEDQLRKEGKTDLLEERKYKDLVADRKRTQEFAKTIKPATQASVEKDPA